MFDKSQQHTFNHTIIAATDMASADESTEMKKPTLFTLPREIRDIIYEYACEGTKVDIWCFESFPPDVLSLRPGSTANGNTGIITTCKQMRVEAQKIYYQETPFGFDRPLDLEEWVRVHVPPEMHCNIKTLRITCWYIDCSLCFINQHRGVETPALASLGVEEFVLSRNVAMDHLTAAREAVTRSVIVSTLSLDAIQIPVVDHKLELVWTSKPGEVPLPTYDDLVEFDNKRK